MNRRVVITGIGPVTTFGSGREALRDVLRSGPPATDSGTERPSVVCNLEAGGSDRRLRHVDRLGRLALAAARLGIEDSGLEARPELEAMGVSVGSGLGCLATNAQYLRGILSKGARFGNPIVFQNTVSNAAAGYVSATWGLGGPTATYCSGSMAGLEALEFAVYRVADGSCDGMLVVSAEELSPWLAEAYAATGELSRAGVGRPLDRGRDGVVLTEGACALVIESHAQAEHRNARVYAEVASLGRASLEGASTAAVDLPDVVFAGANGSRKRDRQEARGLRRLLGAAGAAVPVSCPKGALGETVGSSGGFGVAAAALALWSGEVPPTANLLESDRELSLNAVSRVPLALEPKVALASALDGDGGLFTTLLRKCA